MDAAQHSLANAIAAGFARLQAVEAVALGGSIGPGSVGADAASDLDLYVYTRGDIPVDERRAIIETIGGAARADFGLTYWGPGDELIAAAGGVEVDLTYFDAGWMAERLDRVLVRYEPSLGYSTCFWHTVAGSVALADPRGWFRALQERSRAPYPEQLRANIVSYNHPVLREVIPSWAGQLAKAVKRGDVVSVNHRLAGLLASCFDIVFAANRVAHPGEKRLLPACAERCARLPDDFVADVRDLIRLADDPALVSGVDRLLDRMDAFLVDEGLLTG